MNYSHQEQIFDPHFARPLTIIGVGAVGGFVTLLAAKAGVSDITVIDFDTVSSHNCPMSIYRPKDVGRYKASALKEIVEDQTGIVIKTCLEAFDGRPLAHTSVVASVDTMAARADIWRAVKGKISVDVLIDTRMSGAYGEKHLIVPASRDDQVRYEATLHSDEKAARQSCGNHGIGYASAGIAADTVAMLTGYWQFGRRKSFDAKRHDLLETV